MGKLPAKPRYGDPCNGCGLCCIAEQCPVSLAIFGEQELCPALEEAGSALGCGLMRNTVDYVPDLPTWGGQALTEAFALMIGAGLGCDGMADGDTDADRLRARPTLIARAQAAIENASPEARMLLEYFRGAAA